MCGLVNALGVMLLQCLFKLPVTSRLINNNNNNNNNNNKTCLLCLNKYQAVEVKVHAFLTLAPAAGQRSASPLSGPYSPEQCLAPTRNWAHDRPARSLDTISTELSGTQLIVRMCSKTIANATVEVWTYWMEHKFAVCNRRIDRLHKLPVISHNGRTKRDKTVSRS